MTSSTENLRLLDEIFERFNRTGQPPGDEMHSEVEWESLREDPDFEVHRGVEAVQRYLAGWGEAFDDLHAERLETVAAGKRVFVWVRLTGKGRRSGVPIEMEQGIVYTFRDGKVVHGAEFTDRAKAMRVAGIEETSHG